VSLWIAMLIMKRAIASTTILAMLAGCATQQTGHRGYGAGWEPVVDIRPHQQASYPNDLRECQAHAAKVISADEAAAQAAVAGAIFGALLGAAAGGNSRFNSRMAGVGAVSAGAGGAAQAEGGQRGITRNCLMGRGYTVLN
jgi:hypothetical protein